MVWLRLPPGIFPLIDGAKAYSQLPGKLLLGKSQELVKEALTTNLTPKPEGRRRIPEPQRLL